VRAAVYHGPHDVRIEEVPAPRPAAGEVLLRVLRSGMCGTDATDWKAGPKTFPVNRPHPVTGHLGPMIIGHEFIGEVVEQGEGATTPVGTLVASGAGVSCGRCDRCLQGRTNLCRQYYTLGLNTAGGMAEFVAVPESTLAVVPDGLSPDAAGLAQPVAVGLHAARRAGARDGDRVVLIGAGAIGTFLLAGLRSLVDVDLTVVDFAGARLERAQRLGATRCVEAGPDAPAKVMAAIGAPGADVVIEASGAPGQLDVALGLTRPGGTVLQVGLPAQPQEIDVWSLVMQEKTIQTTLAHVCGEDLAPALDLLATTSLAAELLDGVHPLEAIGEQLDRLASGQVEGKILFDPTLEG
jgi:(R,R)-butanediol dehydrogenase / meso-butanediol dehydrogenase / diacetyl reductase